MSDRPDAALDLLERADSLSPTMSVAPEEVIAAGRRKVRRRRVSATTGLVASILVGVLWVGGPLGPLRAADPPVPASISWQDGVAVDLFDNGADTVEEPGRPHWEAELRSGEGDPYPELVLTRDGERLAPLPAEDGPGDVLVFTAGDLVVAVWERPPGSLGEKALWTEDPQFAQGGLVDVGGGATLAYAVGEFSGGSSPGLEEVYWFSDLGGHTASGAPVASQRMALDRFRVVLLVDESRGTWALVRPDEPGMVHLDRLTGGAGLYGWTGSVDAPTYVGVLPPGATVLPPGDRPGAAIAHSPLGQRAAVISSDRTASTAPPIRFMLDGAEHVLDSYVEDAAATIDVDGTPVTALAVPEGLELVAGPRTGVIAAAHLADGSATTVRVGDAQLLVVPGWDTGSTDFDALRVRVDDDGRQEWVEPVAVLGTRLYDGRPAILLGLDADGLGAGGSVEGVGVEGDAGEVVEHELEGGVVERDLGR